MIGCFATSREEVTMFTAEERDHVRQHVLEIAKADPRVRAAAITGSLAFGPGDTWSDVDVAFGIADGTPLEPVLEEWTKGIDQECGVLDYFDSRTGAWMYRAFLLESGLEVDVGVTPARTFGARGPNFRVLFGTTHPLALIPGPKPSSLIGRCWLYLLHTRSCIERQRPWQAVSCISDIRATLIALAGIRLGENPAAGRDVDHLPTAVTDPLIDTLVRALDESELRRALTATTRCLIAELEYADPSRAARLKPVLLEFGAPQT
jgi:hypothetical protein